ncbi:MAG: hypothetical protein WKF66_16965 [Pedobacter sp.]
MKPLIVLITTFLMSLLYFMVTGDAYKIQLSGRIAMAAMLLFTSVGHFKFLKGMTLMIPDFIPRRKEIVYATGVLEIAFAICLLIEDIQETVAWILIIFFILLIPANINAAIRRLNYETGMYDGEGIYYLWFRIPLQVLFIAWVYYSSILTY